MPITHDVTPPAMQVHFALAGDASVTYTTEVSSAEHADVLPRCEGTLHFPSGCSRKDIEITVPEMPGIGHEGLQFTVVLTASSGAELLRRKRTCTVNVPRQVRFILL